MNNQQLYQTHRVYKLEFSDCEIRFEEPMKNSSNIPYTSSVSLLQIELIVSAHCMLYCVVAIHYPGWNGSVSVLLT